MDEQTKLDIEKRMWAVLKDAGLTRPPINVENVIRHLRLHLDFYSLEDPGFLKKLQHKFTLQTHKILDVVRESKLVAAWFPEDRKILIDRNLPDAKKPFAQFHETVHSVLPWHESFFLGDTAQTLHPDFQEALEMEANYGASELWFCGPEFRKIAPDFDIKWDSVPKIKDIFGTTLTTTFWKFIVSEQRKPVVGLISESPWSAKGEFSSDRCRYFIRSPLFEKAFSKVDKAFVLAQVESLIKKGRGGPLGNYEIQLADNNGDLHLFSGETFSNTYDLLTILQYKKKISNLF